MTYKHFLESTQRFLTRKLAYSMYATAAARPAKLRPAWRADAAPVASGRREVVELAVEEGLRVVGTVMLLVG